MAGLSIRGRIAASGLAIGPLVVIDARPDSGRQAGSADGESEALSSAIRKAIDALTVQVESADDELTADVLGLQLALIEDPVLAEPAFAAVRAGSSAERAWRDVMGREIEGYLASGDEYFKARASDLHDLQERVLDALAGHAAAPAVPAGAIVVGTDLAPSRFLEIDWRGGAIALSGGSETSHVAMLARARGVPMLVGIDASPDALRAFDRAIVDATSSSRSGALVVAPDAAEIEAGERRLRTREAQSAAAAATEAGPVRTADGVPVKILLNVSHASDLDGLSPDAYDGIGLVRTEFLFGNSGDLPDEERQYRLYRDLAQWAQGRPVTVRTLDAGGDKPVRGLTHDDEANPFLGVRGIRLSLERPEPFRVQLRALARAAVHGRLRVMLPMVTVPDELERARAILDEEIALLRERAIEHARPELGIMVEVPAAALRAADFAADFYSVGSNDLTQYVAAAGRDVPALAHLLDPVQPAVLDLVAHVCRAAHARNVDVGLCGDAAGDPRATHALLKAGLRALSMAPRQVAQARLAIALTSLA